jgi:signal transduction histidine kinase
MLNLLDSYRRDLEETFAGRYEPFLRALDQLVEGIDLDSALSVIDDDKTDLEERVRDLNAVAQVGITVEIVGHELESLDAEVRRNLLRLPETVRKSAAFKLAFEAHGALTERLRFLSPLKIAGYRSRQRITGAQIADYVQDFFGRTLQGNRIEFTVTPAFRSLAIIDLPSRIFPVFINLVNNAIYWVSQVSDRELKLDLVDRLVIVADSGRGVDPDDVPRLFELFFTRRRDGRGVGLYLCRVNLAVAHHKIRYATEDDPKVLSGANFVIEFRGLTLDG